MIFDILTMILIVVDICFFFIALNEHGDVESKLVSNLLALNILALLRLLMEKS